MHKHIIRKLDKKVKRVKPVQEVGVKTLGRLPVVLRYWIKYCNCSVCV